MKITYLLFSILLASMAASCKLEKLPIKCAAIKSVTPNIAGAGETVTLVGEHLGFYDPSFYELSINDDPLPSSNIKSFDHENDELTFEIPNDMPSGMISVKLLNGFEDNCETTIANGAMYYSKPKLDMDAMIEEINGGPDSTFKYPQGLEVGEDGTVYVADFGNHAIRTIDPENYEVGLYAGIFDSIGHENGWVFDCNTCPSVIARFNKPCDLAFDNGYNYLYVTEHGNHWLRRIDFNNGKVGDISGQKDNFVGMEYGTEEPGSKASFIIPEGVALFPSSNAFIYLVDYADQNIKRINSMEPYSTSVLAGGGLSTDPCVATEDGKGFAANFCEPDGATAGSNDIIYIAESHKDVASIRTLTKDGTVNTISIDPDQVSLGRPMDLALYDEFTLLIADYDKNIIFWLNIPEKKLEALTSPQVVQLDGPLGLAYDQKRKRIYVSSTNSHTVYMIPLKH